MVLATSSSIGNESEVMTAIAFVIASNWKCPVALLLKWNHAVIAIYVARHPSESITP